MLGKLIKYEIKSIYKYFAVLYAIIILGAVMTSFGHIADKYWLFSDIIAVAFIVGLMAAVALSVVLLIFTITRFNTSLLGDEGYLMFTIPTSTHKIVWSKALALLIFNILSVLVVVAAAVIVGFNVYNQTGFKLPENDMVALNTILKNPSTYLGILVTIVCAVLSILETIFIIFASLSFGQLPGLKKHKNIFAFAFFAVYNSLYSYIALKINGPSMNNIIEKFNNSSTLITDSNTSLALNHNIDAVISFLDKLQFHVIAQSVVDIIILYAIIYYILNRKLNLD